MNFLSITGPKADIDRVVKHLPVQVRNSSGERTLWTDHSRKPDTFPGGQSLQRRLKFHQYHLRRAEKPSCCFQQKPRYWNSTFHSKGDPLPGGSAPERTGRTGRNMFLSGRISADHTSIPKYWLQYFLHTSSEIHPFSFWTYWKTVLWKIQEIYLRQSEHHLP